MSSMPSTLQGGPVTTNSLAKGWYIIIHILLIWLSALPPLLLVWVRLYTFKIYGMKWVFILTLPVFVVIWYFAWLFSAIFFSKIFLVVVNIVYKPKEGYFPRDKKNKDFKFWSLRATIKKFAFWLCHKFPLPWLDIVAFKWFGVKVSINTSLFDAWVDSEFIEIGSHSMIGQGSVIMSSMVTRDWLVLRKVKIGDHCVVGGYSVVAPGTTIEDNVVLAVHSSTSVGQILESDWVYIGQPAKKYKKNEFMSVEESDEWLRQKKLKYEPLNESKRE
jgi:carbonic anhydrase/acetyltransferase-like protein (isoleucine patch superfamily)